MMQYVFILGVLITLRNGFYFAAGSKPSSFTANITAMDFLDVTYDLKTEQRTNIHSIVLH